VVAEFHPILYAFVNIDVSGNGTDLCNNLGISNSLFQRTISSLLTSRSAELLRLSTWLPWVSCLSLHIKNAELTPI
jgi:hypothetical protein